MAATAVLARCPHGLAQHKRLIHKVLDLNLYIMEHLRNSSPTILSCSALLQAVKRY